MLQLDGSSTFGTAQHCLPLPSASVGLKPLNCGSVTNPNEPSLTNALWTSVDQCGPHPSATHCGPQWSPSPTHCSVWTSVDHTSKLSPFSIRRSTLLHCRLFTLHFALLHFCTAVYSIFALYSYSLWSSLHRNTVHSCALRAICRRQDFA